MATNGSVLPMKIQGNEFLCRVLALSVLVACDMGCSHADAPGVYRESQGTVAEFTAELTDRTLTIAVAFIKLQDGTVIHPKVYYYQVHKTLIGVRSVEKLGRLWRTFGRDRKPTYRALHLPTSEEIATHLLLVRTSVLKEGRKRKAKFDKEDYEMGDWQLLEIEAKDLSPEKPLVIPAFEELTKRKLTKEQKELLADLVQRYDVLEAAAWKKAATPVKPGDKKPWWRW